MPNIPTHWIPIYGAGHGIFYDPIGKLFYGDGEPRATLERLDGSMQQIDNSVPSPPIGFQPEDILHFQPPSMTEPLVQQVEDEPNAIRRYYCRCEDAWLEESHQCPVEGQWEDAFEDPVSPAGTISAIRPGDVIPMESITHELVMGDLSYLVPQQRFAYEHGSPMPILLGRGSAIALANPAAKGVTGDGWFHWNQRR
ncbi:MAG: hypothetical protein Q9170_001158 [Blastenia crenularia]